MKKSEFRQIIRDELIKLEIVESWFNYTNDADIEDLNKITELNYNISDVYPIDSKTKTSIEFRDNLSRHHITKLYVQGDYMELKLYWVDTNNNIQMTAPPNITPKIMNTHISNFINQLLPKYDKFLIRPIDSVRFRLFTILINKYIDKKVWNVTTYKDTIIINKMS